SEDSANFHPNEIGRRTRMRFRNIDPAVAEKISRILSIALHSLFIGDEHRDAGAIGAVVKDLLSRVIVGTKFYFWFEQDFTRALVEVIAKNFRRRSETGEGIKRLAIFTFAGKSPGSTETGQRDLAVTRA